MRNYRQLNVSNTCEVAVMSDHTKQCSVTYHPKPPEKTKYFEISEFWKKDFNGVCDVYWKNLMDLSNPFGSGIFRDIVML